LKEYVQLTEKRKDLLFGIWANVQSKNMMHEGVSFLAPSGKVIFKSWLPQKQATQQIVLRCLWTSYDYLTSNKEQDDIVIGGITDFRMFTYPETAKTQFKWTMRKVLSVEERLRTIPFPDVMTTMVDNPVDIQIRVPDTLYTTEDATSIKIGVWDETVQDWNTEWILPEISYDPAERMVKFQSTKFAPIAMLQSRCTDYPYKHWVFRATAD